MYLIFLHAAWGSFPNIMKKPFQEFKSGICTVGTQPSCFLIGHLRSLASVRGFSSGSAGTESTCHAGDPGSASGLERCPGERNGYLLQYSGQENSMGCKIHRVANSQTRLSDFHFHSGEMNAHRYSHKHITHVTNINDA